MTKQIYQIYNSYSRLHEEEINKLLQKDDSSRIEAMKQILSFELNNQNELDIMMNIIRYILPSNNHEIKRLFLLYLSSIKRVDENGKLLPELILVINGLLQDLNHPNEYIRMLTLKFIMNVKEKEFIQPLANSVVMSYESNSSIVRKHCYSAICHIYKLYPELIPNAKEIIKKIMIKEKNKANKCSALRAMMYIDLQATINYIIKKSEQIQTYDENFQMEILKLIKSVHKSTPENYSKYITICMNLIENPNMKISLEASNCMLSISSSNTIVKVAIKNLIDIIVKTSDINVKIIVLQKIEEQINKTPKIMKESEIELLRLFQTNSIYIKKKVIDIIMECITNKTVKEVIMMMKKEIEKEENEEYQNKIIEKMREINEKYTHEIII